MGGLRQERVGGGRTNLAGGGGPPADRPHTSSGSLPSSAGSRPSTAGARHRPPPAPLDEASSSQLVVWPNDRGSRPTSAPARRPSTEPAGSAGPPRPWQNAEETGGRGQPISASASGFEGVTRNRVKRDELFGNGSDKGGSSRPSTASSRDSRASREGLPPRARPGSAPNQRQNEDERLATTSSMNSETSSACEERLLSFQKYFQDKNFAKFSHLKDAFRDVDKDKNGTLGSEEVGMAMASLDIPVDKKIIQRLMSRCADPEGMTMQEFKDLLWIDDTMETYIDDRKNRRAGVEMNQSHK